MKHNYIFVYGLLKTMYDNEPARFIRKSCSLVGEGSMSGTLFDLGNYPGAVYDSNASRLVYGEVYKIERNENELVQFLDNFEGVGPQFEEPNEYIRLLVPVTIEHKIIEASTYIYNWNLDGLKVIDSGIYENSAGNR